MQKMLQSVKNHACAWMGALLLILPALDCAAKLSNRELILFLPVLTYIVLTAAVLVLTVAALRNYEEMCRSECAGALLLPAVYSVYELTLLKHLNGWAGCWIFLIGSIALATVFVRCGFASPVRGVLGMVCGGALMVFFSHMQWIACAVTAVIGIVLLIGMKGERLKAMLGAVYGAGAVVIVLMLYISLFSFKYHEHMEFVSEFRISPDGKYTAQLVYVEDRTGDCQEEYIRVKEVNSEIYLLIGQMERTKRISHYLTDNSFFDWDRRKFDPFEWVDEDTISINGELIDIQ